MRPSRLLAFSFVAAATLALGAVAPAQAIDEPLGCCCIAGAGGQACTELTEKACLARQQAVPKYDAKTNYDSALKKSESEEAGKEKSGWKVGKCEMPK